MRILSETWSPAKDRLEIEVAGAANQEYILKLWNAASLERSEGAQLNFPRNAIGPFLSVRIPASDRETYPHARIVLYFALKPGVPKAPD